MLYIELLKKIEFINGYYLCTNLDDRTVLDLNQMQVTVFEIRICKPKIWKEMLRELCRNIQFRQCMHVCGLYMRAKEYIYDRKEGIKSTIHST